MDYPVSCVLGSSLAQFGDPKNFCAVTQFFSANLDPDFCEFSRDMVHKF